MEKKKPASKKTATKKKAPAKKKAVSSKKSTKPSTTTDKSLRGEELYLKIQKAAYYLAEKDSFERDSMYYWLEAKNQLGIK